jgi:GH15 family glucan-1,4-alpha-glucosidase
MKLMIDSRKIQSRLRSKVSIPLKKARVSWWILGSAAGLVLGLLIGKGIGFLRYVLRQPRFISRAVASLLEGTELLEDKAYDIASDNLISGIEKRLLFNGEEKLVVVAGPRNFREPWARDFGFAAFGLLSEGQNTAVKECLEVFFLYQNEDGQFPVKIHSTTIPSRYIHSLFKREQPITAPIRPKYFSGHRTISLDGSGLVVIAALHYASVKNDGYFVTEYWNSLKKAVLWLDKFSLEADGLLHQGAFSDWADSIARSGRVLYTNVIYWKALKEMASTARRLGYDEDFMFFEGKTSQVEKSIHDHFWRQDLGYYVTSSQFDNLSSSGNLLAVAWGLASDEIAHSILDAMHEYDMAQPVPTRPVHRPYPIRFVALENRIGGIGHYHTDAAWLWLGGWHVIALSRMGRLDEAKVLLDRMAKVIVGDGEVHEVYGTDGKFISKLLYTSESPLTWSAGMYVYAYHYYRTIRGKGTLPGEVIPYEIEEPVQAWEEK